MIVEWQSAIIITRLSPRTVYIQTYEKYVMGGMSKDKYSKAECCIFVHMSIGGDIVL